PRFPAPLLGRFLLDVVRAGAGDPAFLQRQVQGSVVDDGPAAVLTRMSVGCGRAVIEHDDRDDAHGRKLAEYVLGDGWARCHGGYPAAAPGPPEPAGYSNSGTRSFDQADNTGATTRHDPSASAPPVDKAAVPFTTSHRDRPHAGSPAAAY